jgi:hypothetical protein
MMDGLWGVLAQVKDLATLVLLLALLGLGWLHVQMIKENRVDRQALVDLLLKNTEALNGIKVMIAAISGKAL